MVTIFQIHPGSIPMSQTQFYSEALLNPGLPYGYMGYPQSQSAQLRGSYHGWNQPHLPSTSHLSYFGAESPLSGIIF